MTTEKKETALAVKPENIADQVLVKIQNLTAAGMLNLPKEYSAENALKGAFIILQETKDKNGKPALEVCTKESIALALYGMVVKGLNPIKKQCYFIPYGNKLTCPESYFGNIMLARRFGMADIAANVIYEGDKFLYKVDEKTGRKIMIEHTTSVENIDLNKIKGAYAIYTMQDGKQNMEVMNWKQIQQAWQQGYAKGNSPAHKNFPDQMAEKSVINRACKIIINGSDDSSLFLDDPDFKTPEEITPHTVVEENANKETLTFTDAPIVELTPEPEPEQAPGKTEPEVKEKTAAPAEKTKGPKF